METYPAKETPAFSPAVLWELLFFLAGYRQKMRVTEVLIISSALYGKTGYYVCPRCSITLEREFMAFCDRCGQRLDWKDYRKAKKIYPGQRHSQRA